MSEAVIGLLGAVIGATLGGVGKLLQDAMQRRLESRTAARILSLVMMEILADVRHMKSSGRIKADSPDWRTYADAWTEHQLALARVIPSACFSDIAFVFAAMRNLETVAKKDEVVANHAPGAALLASLIKKIESVGPRLDWAGYTHGERNEAFASGLFGVTPLGDWPSRLLFGRGRLYDGPSGPSPWAPDDKN